MWVLIVVFGLLVFYFSNKKEIPKGKKYDGEFGAIEKAIDNKKPLTAANEMVNSLHKSMVEARKKRENDKIRNQDDNEGHLFDFKDKKIKSIYNIPSVLERFEGNPYHGIGKVYGNNRPLFHITNINNLLSILENGLLSHNRIEGYFDISDKDINNRRSIKKETIFNRVLHDYVPTFFNPRNAMLFRVQKECRDDIVIIELDKSLCLSDESVFSYRNAASNSALFYSSMKKVENWDWDMVFKEEWFDSNEVKQIMMSECLVFDRIDPELFNIIHFQNINTLNLIKERCAGIDLDKSIEIKFSVSPDMFFNFH